MENILPSISKVTTGTPKFNRPGEYDFVAIDYFSLKEEKYEKF